MKFQSGNRLEPSLAVGGCVGQEVFVRGQRPTHDGDAEELEIWMSSSD